MLDGVDILAGDPRRHPREVVDAWIDELQFLILDGKPDDVHEETVTLRKTFGFRPLTASVLRVLASGRPHSLISIGGRVLDDLEVYQDKDGMGPTIIRVEVCHIRKVFKRDYPNLKINTIWGFGYQCPPETCAELKRIMKPA